MKGPMPSSPLLPPPTEINDTHKVYSIAIAIIILCIVTVTIVVARLVNRIRAQSFGKDDATIIPAVLFYTGWSVMGAYVNLHAGVGKPLWEITVGEYSIWFQGIIGSAWLYPAMTMFIRLSIIFFYLRIFEPIVAFRYTLYGLMVLQGIYLVVYSILPAFICQPLWEAWQPLTRQAYFNDWYYYYLQVALFSTSMAFDAVLLFLPIWPIWKLQMKKTRKAGISLLFMLGAAASIAAAYKLAIFVIEMARYTDINPRWSQYQMSLLIPPQFDTYGTTFWIPSQVEPTVALIGSSLPALRRPMSLVGRNLSNRISRLLSASKRTGDNSYKLSQGEHSSYTSYTPNRGYGSREVYDGSMKSKQEPDPTF